jgi:hypothetical protein
MKITRNKFYYNGIKKSLYEVKYWDNDIEAGDKLNYEVVKGIIEAIKKIYNKDVKLLTCSYIKDSSLLNRFNPYNTLLQFTDIEDETKKTKEVTVYTENGAIIDRYRGEVEVESCKNRVVRVNHKGKEYVYYNCRVTVTEK